LRSIDQWQKVRTHIERLPDVTAVTPVVSGPGFALRGDANKAVNITGIEPDTYLNVISLGDKIIDGKLSVASSDIIIGTELAQDLGAGVGDKLRLTTASGASTTLNVTGIFDFGNKRVNEANVYISLHVAQNLLNLVGGVSSIELKVRDPFDAETIAQIIQDETGQEADSWIKTNAQFFTAMLAQTLTNRLIRFFVGLTAALGIASVLVVSVVQKSKEIGILRAMGTSSGQVLRVFLLQGAVMALAGSVLGSGLSFVFLAFFRSIARNPDGTVMFVIEIDASLLAVTAIGATLVGLLAAALPARLAAQLDPAVAIRG
jgi:lipoprotein-releasing system permease protein